MNEIRILLNLLIKYTENHYKIIELIKPNMTVCVIILLDMSMKTTKMNLFYKHEYKNKIKFF